MTGIKLVKGQRVRLETPGGGGYGNPNSRPQNLIDNDIEQGYVSGKST
jgi:N-methylhydantoinase B